MIISVWGQSIVKLFAAGIVFAIVLASGQARAWAQAGWYLTPSFRVSESFDDNVFGSSSNAQSDVISRFSPGLQAGYRSDPLSLLFNGGFDAAVFAKNPQLNDATEGWHTGLTLQYLPTRPLTLGLNATYTETRSLTTLTQALTAQALTAPTPATTLEFGRQKTTFLSAAPSVAYQFTPLTSGTSGYTFTQSTQEGAATNTAQQVQLGLSRRFTPLDTGTLSYRLDIFENSGSSTTTSNTPTIGWTRQLTPQTTGSLQAGPRFSSDGKVHPDVSASLAYQFKVADQVGTASLAYAHSEGFVIGQAGTVTTESLSGSIGYEPLRSLQVSVAPAVTRLSGGTTADTTTYGVTAVTSYQILKWLAARASSSFSYQNQTGNNIRHNVFTLSLDATYPVRVDQ